MMALMSALETLRAANRLLQTPAYSWHLSSEDGAPVMGSNGIAITVDSAFGLGPIPKHVFVCSSLSTRIVNQDRLFKVLHRRRRAKIPLGALSTGTIILARAGLLNNKRCTIHRTSRAALLVEFPDINCTHAAYEIDEPVWTAAGGIGAMRLFLKLIDSEYGNSLGEAIAREFYLDAGTVESDCAHECPPPMSVGQGCLTNELLHTHKK